METTTVVTLVKERLGIKSNVRDTYLTAIIEGIIKELDDKLRKADIIAAIKEAMGQ